MLHWYVLLRLEWRAVLGNRSVLLMIFGGLLLYGFLYPRPYLNQVPRDLPIALINHDHSQLSRRVERMVNATPQVQVAYRAGSVREAQNLMAQGKVNGFLLIPEHFYRDLRLGRSPTLSLAGDASYFLVYATVVEGLARVSGTLAAGVQVTRLMVAGVPAHIGAEHYAPLRLQSDAVFNTALGYVDYVIPAVFLLLLHQTLFMAVGLHSAAQNSYAPQQTGYWMRAPAWQLFVARSTVFLLIYLLMSAFYLGPLFAYYKIRVWANIGELLLLLVPFLVSVISLSILVAQYLRHPVYATVVGLVSSLPLVFTSGFIWPLSEVPLALNFLADLVPAKAGIQGMLKLNQMQAGLRGVLPHYQQLCVLALVYSLSAMASLARTQQRQGLAQAKHRQ